MKLVLRSNAYVCWLLTWIGLNNTVAKAAPHYGIEYQTLALPAAVYDFIVIVGCISGVAVLGVLIQCWRRSRALAWNGIVAYLATLYLWVVFARINPLVYLVIPTFHSLQYLTVVWRYQLNAGSGTVGEKPGFRFALLDQ
jgi:hypothetical protein